MSFINRLPIRYTLLYAVLHNMDLLRCLSLLWMALAGKQQEHCGLDKETTNERRCLWVLSVARALMDVVMSVAASVISSLLLNSGDVEENPGPGTGGRPGCIHNMIKNGIVAALHVLKFTDIDYKDVDATKILGMFVCKLCLTYSDA